VLNVKVLFKFFFLELNPIPCSFGTINVAILKTKIVVE